MRIVRHPSRNKRELWRILYRLIDSREYFHWLSVVWRIHLFVRKWQQEGSKLLYENVKIIFTNEIWRKLERDLIFYFVISNVSLSFSAIAEFDQIIFNSIKITNDQKFLVLWNQCKKTVTQLRRFLKKVHSASVWIQLQETCRKPKICWNEKEI
jgi:hypothetical protein